VYIFDRMNKFWWKLNDHFVSIEDEETVFVNAFGGNDASCSACNLVYISEKVAIEIDKNKTYVFSES